MSIVGKWKDGGWPAIGDGPDLGVGSVRIDSEGGYIDYCITVEHVEDDGKPFEDGETVEILVRRREEP